MSKVYQTTNHRQCELTINKSHFLNTFYDHTVSFKNRADFYATQYTEKKSAITFNCRINLQKTLILTDERGPIV